MEFTDFLLLQLNDALFPIGAYSHSYGLETFVLNNLVFDEKSASDYIRQQILYNLSFSELMAVRLSYEAALKKDLTQLSKLEELYEASRGPKEVRTASSKLGSRFIKTVQTFMKADIDFFLKYKELCCTHTHPSAYGVFCAVCKIPLEKAMQTFLYSQVSSMVTNCVKLVPLSQTSGQKILYESYAWFPEALKKAAEADQSEYGRGAPGFDIRCMQHEFSYSRLYMS